MSSSVKSVKRTAERVIEMVNSGAYDPDIIEHMIGSLVTSRDRKIKHLQRKIKPRELYFTENIVSGALRECIKIHGPITKDFISSATKRIYNNCFRIIDEHNEQKKAV